MVEDVVITNYYMIAAVVMLVAGAGLIAGMIVGMILFGTKASNSRARNTKKD